MKLCALLLAALLPCLAQGPLPVDQNKAFGNPSAAVRLDVFSDFSCPACRAFHLEMLPQIERDYGPSGKIYIVQHEFPLNIPAHKYSREAADIATAAARIGKFDAVADALFQNQNTWMENGKIWDVLNNVLTPADQKKIQGMLKDPAIPAEVQNDVNVGTRLNINSTPSIFLSNGSQRFSLPWPINYQLFRQMVDRMK